MEGQRDAERALEPGPEQPAPAEAQQQRHTADGGRQHHREQHQRADEGLALERDTGQQPGERHTEEQRETEGPQGHEQREAQGLDHTGAGEVGAEFAPLGAGEDADEG